jgi:hypothetical protein
LKELRLAAASNGDKGSRMKFSIAVTVAAASLLVACGEKTEEVKAPPSKSAAESSIDAVLGNAPTPPPSTPAPTAVPSTPSQPKTAAAHSETPGVSSPLMNQNYDRQVRWLQVLQTGTLPEKQAVRMEIARSGMSPKEMEQFQKLKAHYGIKD